MDFSKGIIQPKGSKQIVTTFQPKSITNQSGIMHLMFEDGDGFLCELEGEGYGMDIRLSDELISLPSTYIGTRSCATIQVINNGDRAAFIKWEPMVDCFTLIIWL